MPTFAEAGQPRFDVPYWFALAAPAATPQPIVERLNREVVRACAQPRLREAFAKQAALAVTSTPEEMTRHLAREIEVWRDVVTRANDHASNEPRERAAARVPRAAADACDAHFHVFGPADRYPHGGVNEKLRYAPPLAPLSDYLALAQHLGIERFVFVQPSAYGRDNACMLDAMREVGIARCRGIVDVDEDAPDALLAEMDKLGVRGVRINVSPVKPPEPGFSDNDAAAHRAPRRALRRARLASRLPHARLADRGTAAGLREDALRVQPRPHGHVPRQGRTAAAGLPKLLDLLRHGDGRAWVKLTGTYRMATPPDFADAAPMARALIEAAPDRLIWGSDYPHLSFADKVGSVQLFNLLADWADEPTRRQAHPRRQSRPNAVRILS